MLYTLGLRSAGHPSAIVLEEFLGFKATGSWVNCAVMNAFNP